MQQYGQGAEEQQVVIEASGRNSDRNQDPNSNSSAPDATAEHHPVLTIVVSKPEEATNAKGDGSKGTSPERQDKVSVIASAKKGFLPRSDSDCEECRICQQPSEEPLIDLGCGCRGELAKAHRSCIEIWFRTKGSNKCEICQQVAVNVPLLDSQPATNYWVWRVGSIYGGSNIGRRGRERGCVSPLWVAFAILIGGLLLDVLVSVSLGVSALPVNIIIGVLIVLGLGTALRLALECCHEWRSRRPARGTEIDMNPGSNPIA
ncbi:uncharacterized protein LOC110024470 isoform X1 [Phalaenopsis equestris]|uniref:uncharacterized protein LOC110024470 isoform X1 n=1 Tax=Phalaenopsis equestris TaxID=78828 RepID=UPI0009E3B900|nr:uncharacterized protein LOC110024470 isoform X1 [Phalaenopsis equestris]XP_020580124.1 uncharacterized protein LOC110024470 isoform X1 [Phalaenopsis equestris]XP_020580131.1 uncharacterized protein LOC110024470 isoform X1 [Phalaenopsis equestris]